MKRQQADDNMKRHEGARKQQLVGGEARLMQRRIGRTRWRRRSSRTRRKRADAAAAKEAAEKEEA